MSNQWKTTTLTSEPEVLNVLTELRGKRWLSRGQSKSYNGKLIPSIDRGDNQHLSRSEKLALERQSIDIFRSTARFVNQNEQDALGADLTTLMLLRHHGIPTRLMDWSLSPQVAAYFAVEDKDGEDGEIWSFDHDLYVRNGGEQWKKDPETTIDHSGRGDKFRVELTAFKLEEPSDWFVCIFYPPGFSRQNAQEGFYSMTGRFNRDHAERIANLLGEQAYFHRYQISAAIKPALRKHLRDKHGIWRGSLFPDIAGAADTVKNAIFPDRFTKNEACHVTSDRDILNGEPIIRGTRIPVRAIVEIWQLGVPAEEIPKRLPHLTLGQVFGTLSYYSDNQDEINEYIRRNRVPDELIDPLVQNL